MSEDMFAVLTMTLFAVSAALFLSVIIVKFWVL